MATQVTLKLSVIEFDQLRSVVKERAAQVAAALKMASEKKDHAALRELGKEQFMLENLERVLS